LLHASKPASQLWTCPSGQYHIYVAGKAAWFTIIDDLPQFPELPKKR
jgi:hypothetical protein